MLTLSNATTITYLKPHNAHCRIASSSLGDKRIFCESSRCRSKRKMFAI